MNNKSTENLIESGGSVEEIQALDVPPLDLNNRKASITDPVDNKPAIDVHKKKASNRFFVEKSKEDATELKPLNPPVPAARKLSLPPIASKRNGKDLKENSNQLTRKQSVRSDDTIQLVNERTIQPRKSNKDQTDSGSDSDIRQNNSSTRDKRNKIELSLISKEAKKHLGRQFVGNQVNEETTSFISYEEKHEKEDNSEHNDSSNHSSANIKNLSNDENVGRKNEAFIPDDDLLSDGENHPKPTESAEVKHKTKSKKKDKKSKSTKKSKTKRIKTTTQNVEETVEHIESTEERDIQEIYDFKRLIGNKTVISFFVKYDSK